MNAVKFFEGIGIIAKYGGERKKKPKDPETRVRFACSGVSEEDCKKLKELGYDYDGDSWYCDT